MKYNKLSRAGSLETVKQRRTALVAHLKRYTRSVEAQRINRLVTTEPSKVYSQREDNKMRKDPPRGETKQYLKNIWEKEASHNTQAHWLMDLKEDHSHLPDQDPVKIIMADI